MQRRTSVAHELDSSTKDVRCPWTSGATTGSRFRCPRAHRFPLTKYTLLRARLEADGIARPDDIHESRARALGVDRGRAGARARRAPAHGPLSVREQRGLGLPWSPALVERARRTAAGTVAAARRALAHGVGMNLGGGTHHAGYDFARGYCLFNDVAVALASCAPTGACGARSWSTATSTRATAPRRSSPATAGRSRCRCTARATTRSSASRRTSTSTFPRAPATTLPARARRCARRRASPGAARGRLLPRRRRPVRGRPPRAPGPQQDRAAGARRARHRATATRRRRGRRPAGWRLRPRRRRHRRHQRRDGGRRCRGRCGR